MNTRNVVCAVCVEDRELAEKLLAAMLDDSASNLGLDQFEFQLEHDEKQPTMIFS